MPRWSVKYTYAGDANLDGKVDVLDLTALAQNWQSTASGPAVISTMTDL